jgi:hypothetical protein
MSFEALDKNSMPGYYNHTEASWGGFPIAHDGGFALFHAQMANSCSLDTWTDNSIGTSPARLARHWASAVGSEVEEVMCWLPTVNITGSAVLDRHPA